MAKTVELRRHTDSDGDRLSEDGVRAAVAIGTRLEGGYDLLVSSGAQRATQTLACFLAGHGGKHESGVTVDYRFRSEVENRWRAAYQKAGAGDIASFRRADPELVEQESARLADALQGVFDGLPEGGRALVVGHSPMNEAAVYGLTGQEVEPLSKGAGVIVTEEDGTYRVRAAPA
ncbi:MAG TPA: histidine phosphatase family protein [Actinomycetota bacterium]|jgi:phosphohistidine phosphatase SixA|nr:histidine phosphatase family protein [Actinomycetota bacterium]